MKINYNKSISINELYSKKNNYYTCLRKLSGFFSRSCKLHVIFFCVIIVLSVFVANANTLEGAKSEPMFYLGAHID